METMTPVLNERFISAIEDLTYELRRANDRREREDEDSVVSVTEAAEIAGRTRQTVSRWIATGKIRKVSKGCRTGVRLSDLYRVSGTE